MEDRRGGTEKKHVIKWDSQCQEITRHIITTVFIQIREFILCDSQLILGRKAFEKHHGQITNPKIEMTPFQWDTIILIMCSYEYAFRIEHLLEKAASTDQKWSFPITYCIVSLNIVNTDPNY